MFQSRLSMAVPSVAFYSDTTFSLMIEICSIFLFGVDADFESDFFVFFI